MVILKQEFRYSKEEQETHLSSDGRTWIAETSIPKDIRKFIKQGWKVEEQYVCPDGSIASIRCTAPVNFITIGNVNRKKKQLTEEHKEALLRGREKAY